MNIDELWAQIEQDELEDQEIMSPVEYARLRNMAPQLVYYHVRAKHLELGRCACGRRCLNKKAADDYFSKAKKAGRESLQTDKRPDEERP